jgi:hypothetical protein
LMTMLPSNLLAGVRAFLGWI